MTKQFVVDVEGEQIPVSLSQDKLSILGKNVCASLIELRPSVYSLLLNGNSYLVHLENGADTLLTINGETVKSRIVSERSELILRYGQQTRDQETTNELQAPMSGLIMKIMTKVGNYVTKGQGLIVLEAMKMENELRAPCTGHVKRIYVQEKEAVTFDAPLIELEP